MEKCTKPTNIKVLKKEERLKVTIQKEDSNRQLVNQRMKILTSIQRKHQTNLKDKMEESLEVKIHKEDSIKKTMAEPANRLRVIKLILTLMRVKIITK